VEVVASCAYRIRRNSSSRTALTRASVAAAPRECLRAAEVRSVCPTGQGVRWSGAERGVALRATQLLQWVGLFQSGNHGAMDAHQP